MSIYTNILKQYWGYPAFRPLQEDIIRSVAEKNNDTLGLLPTGGGKSIIFQVPALAHEGVCLVITPLIALMKDQVENLKKRGIKAVAIHSGLTKHEIDILLNNAAFGQYKFVYLSPERIHTELFKNRVADMPVNLIAIDEAHCISQWGYDFRPSYLKINELRTLVPDVPFLALTATATPEVVKDIQTKLGFEKENVFRKSFARKNLIYLVREVDDKMRYLLRIAQKMNACGVVYVRSRKRTREIAEFLAQNGVSADYYHAGLKNEVKDLKQQRWMLDQTKVMVSTNAFGMGIDKPDVRFVVHMDLPDSPEAYFQEAGRGGRDEKTAYAVMLFNKADEKRIIQNLKNSFPPREEVRRVYEAIGNFYQLPVGAGKGLVFDFKLSEFVSRYRMSIITVFNSLKILQQEAYLEVTDELNNPSRIKFIVARNDLYKFQVANAKFDSFIKLVLRSYTGLFTDYARIDEEFLAKKSNATRDLVYEYFTRLAKLKIINYIPQKRTPLLIFTEERVPTKSLLISREHYEDRLKRATKRSNAMIDYATNKIMCRSRNLLAYFGEHNAPNCGKCDVCQSKKESEVTNEQIAVIKTEAKRLMSEEKLRLDQLPNKIDVQGCTPNNIIEVLRLLAQEGEI